MKRYQNIKGVAYAAIATLVIVGLVAIFAAVSGDIKTLFFAVSGVICAFASICAADSALAESRRTYNRRIRR